MESIKNLHEIASMLDPEILVSPPRLVDVSKYASINTTVEVSFTVSIPPEKGIKPLPQWLIEAARAEEDERLGVWRWPENPDYVVYHARDVNGDHKVIELSTGCGTLWGRDMEPEPQSSDMGEAAARAYFDAHPEPKPIPNEPRSAWVDKYGTDVWVVGGDGVLRCVSSPSSDPAKYAPFTRLVPEAAS